MKKEDERDSQTKISPPTTSFSISYTFLHNADAEFFDFSMKIIGKLPTTLSQSNFQKTLTFRRMALFIKKHIGLLPNFPSVRSMAATT